MLKAWKRGSMGPAGNLDNHNLATVQGIQKGLLKEQEIRLGALVGAFDEATSCYT